MNIPDSKQQQLTFDKGITNVPSDAICSDNALAECIGLVYADGEHRVIQAPKRFFTSSAFTILYVHKFNSLERFVGYTQNSEYCWGIVRNGELQLQGTFPGLLYAHGNMVTSVGKTLIIADSNGMHYYLWTKSSQNQDSYESLGSSFPRPEVSFKLTGRNDNRVEEEIRCDGILYQRENGNAGIVLGKQNDWNNAAVALYTKLKKDLGKKKKFQGSFCVRVALKLYDGTYFHIGNPIFMLNHFSTYCTAAISGLDSLPVAQMELYGQELEYKFSQDFTKWADIIKGVTVFVTRESDLVDTTLDAKVDVPNDGDNIPRAYFMSGNGVYRDNHSITELDQSGQSHVLWYPEDNASLEEVIKDGVYYKLCDIGMQGDSNWHPCSDHFDTHTLENITTQDQLGEDDFYSHCPFRPGLLYPYNARLNMANVARGFFKGFDSFMPYDGEEHSYSFYVTIATDSGSVVVVKDVTTAQKQGLYFYYPDPRAKHVVITKDATVILSANLTEHPTLNGAYYFAGITLIPGPPPSIDIPTSTGTVPTVTPEASAIEYLPNTIITSEANNPYVFKAHGYNNVGTGQVIGMSTITQALSQGQFGQYPLLVFSTEGIWAMAVNSEGLYSAVHPMSREVCNTPASITQTDGAVFFTSKKGLMLIEGSQVRCVSQQMAGKTDAFAAAMYSASDLGNFATFLEQCFIAYDYRDSMLWLFSNSGMEYCYVYSIRSGTFAKYHFNISEEGQEIHWVNVIVNAMNNYPDYLLQTNSGVVFSLMRRDDINEDTNDDYAASFLTRPMKLENAFALKTVSEVAHSYFIQQGNLRLRIFASNNLKQAANTWTELHSLLGTPWKYYRFRYDFSGLKATDRFAGTAIVTQERRTDKLR